MKKTVEINLKNNTFLLLPKRAMIWKERRLLILSDLHIGKVSHFRHAGFAVPADALYENFNRLDSIMQQYPIDEVLFAGDLFHSSINKEWQLFHQWRMQYVHIPMSIVLGNHDKLDWHYYEDAMLDIIEEEVYLHPFTFSHHPKTSFHPDEYVISGHVHPVISINGQGRQRLRFPCFYFGAQQCILPAYGYFTGGYQISPVKGDLVIALVNDGLMDVSASAE